MTTSVNGAGPRSLEGFMVASSGKGTKDDLLTCGRPFLTGLSPEHSGRWCGRRASSLCPTNARRTERAAVGVRIRGRLAPRQRRIMKRERIGTVRLGGPADGTG